MGYVAYVVPYMIKDDGKIKWELSEKEKEEKNNVHMNKTLNKLFNKSCVTSIISNEMM